MAIMWQSWDVSLTSPLSLWTLQKPLEQWLSGEGALAPKGIGRCLETALLVTVAGDALAPSR